MKILLDTTVLGELTHPNDEQSKSARQWLHNELASGETVIYVPEIRDYELGRKLLHLAKKSDNVTSKSLNRLDLLTQ